MLDHRAIFVNALRSSSDESRKRIFDHIERHHAQDFANGRAGIELYEKLLSALRDSGMPEVMKEFERRFSSLLSPSPHAATQNLGPREEMIDQDLDVTTVLHHRRLIKEFPLLSPGPPHSNANLAPRKQIRWRPLPRFAVDQLVAKARASLEPISATIARIRAVASEIATAVNDRPRPDWRRPILYVAATSSIAMLGVFVICTSFVSLPDVFAQAVNGGSPAGAPQAQRPPTPTSKLLQPNHDPKEGRSPPSPANVTPSGGSRQPVVPAVPPQVDRSVSGVRNTPSMSVQAKRPRAIERNVGQRITIAGGVLVLPEVAYYGVPVILDVPGLGLVDVPEEEYARLYERLSSSDPERIEAAMVSLRAIKAAADFEVEAAQRRPALSSDDTYLERDLTEPISFDRPSSSSRRQGRSLGLY